MKPSRRLTIVVLAPLALLSLSSFQSGKPDAAPIETVIASPGPVERIVKAKGSLKITYTVDVGAQVSGLLMRLPKREGDMVKKGEVVAEVDDTLARATLDRARYTLENYEATRGAQLAELRRAEQRAERYQGLLKQDAIAREDVEAAVASFEALKAQTVALAAQIRQAKASISTAEVQLSYTTIRSPVDGMVVTVYRNEGETLLATYSVPQILQVADLSKMTVVAQVDEADVSRLTIGQDVFFSVLSAPERRWESKVRQIKPVGQLVDGKVVYEVLFEAENDGSLRSKMTADVSFVDRIEAEVRVPLTAVHSIRGNSGEVQVLKDGVVDTRRIKLKVTGGQYAAVGSGLRPGEAVVVSKPAAKVVAASLFAQP